MPDSTEIELKLAVVKGTPEAAKRALGNVELRCTRLDDVYFDTPDFGLRKRGLALRIRRDGEHWLQTLKASSASSGIVPIRGEWEVPLPEDASAPMPDLARFDVAPLQALLGTGFETNGLAPYFRTRVIRHRGIVIHGTSEIEVAIDRGELRTRLDGHRKRLTVAELELELKSGRAEDLLALASTLAKSRHVTLIPAMRSKAERGYALASSSGLTVARASARGFAEQVSVGMRTPEALRAVIRHGLGIVVANADALRDAPVSEHVHQARVALRRMRSAIRLFDPNGVDIPAPLVDELRWLARRLGRARDWDVLKDATLPSILESAKVKQNLARKLGKIAQHAQVQARDRAVDAVSSRRYASLVLQLALWSLSTAPTPTPPLSEASAMLLDPVADRAFSLTRSFIRLSARRRHRVRILAKRLRYALDLLQATLPPRSGPDYIDALSSLQDSLGELNDASVALDLLLPLLQGKAARKSLEEWFGQVEPKAVARAARQLKALAHRPRPWQNGWMIGRADHHQDAHC
jgi:triphosphatase